MGLDPGTIALGWGMVEAEGEQLPSWGVLRASSRLPLTQRLVLLHKGLTELLERWRPDAVAVEEVFLPRLSTSGGGQRVSPRSALVLGAAHAIVLLAAGQQDLHVVLYAPATIKEAVTGFGRAPKAQVQEMVRRHLGLAAPPCPDHAADALAVALCHLWNGALGRRLSGAADA